MYYYCKETDHSQWDYPSEKLLEKIAQSPSFIELQKANWSKIWNEENNNFWYYKLGDLTETKEDGRWENPLNMRINRSIKHS